MKKIYDVAIIGCGIVGAAMAFELSKYELDIVVVEKENDICCGTTKANSAIIHAGYDPLPGTLMAKLNVMGSQMAKELSAALDIPYKQTGSLVLAFDEEDLKTLNVLYERGLKNSVPGLKLLDKDEVLRIEPEISENVVGALYAPSAAIINPWEYGIALAETAVQNGATLLLSSEVLSITDDESVWNIHTSSEDICARYIINAAGVNSDIIHNMVAKPSFRIEPNKGEYFLLDKSEGNRVQHIIFQCPSKTTKGVLVAPTVHGNLIVGPNASQTDREDVSNTRDGLDYVRTAAVRSVPSISFRDNIRNFAGVRANSDKEDFIIENSAPRFIDLAGIKSPGLSAAPAIAVYATELLQNDGLALEKKSNWIGTRKKVRFSELSTEEKNKHISENPAYGRVICRCETITEGEIIDSLRGPIPALTIDGVKRRTGSGMGRCQGGFCGPRILEIIAREHNIAPEDIFQDKQGSYILTGQTKREETYHA
jgi:glycerol-3-phosphate dehydrogenase